SIVTLTPIISGAVSIGQGLATLDTTTPAVLLLTFYLMGIVLIVLLLGMRYSGKLFKQEGVPPLLVEALPTTAVLAVTAAHPPSTEQEAPNHEADASEAPM